MERILSWSLAESKNQNRLQKRNSKGGYAPPGGGFKRAKSVWEGFGDILS
jgi:hypothetical protein